MAPDPTPLELAEAALAGAAGPALACVVRRRAAGAVLDATGAVHEAVTTTTQVRVARPGPGHPGHPAAHAGLRSHDGFDLATASASPAQAAGLLERAAAALEAGDGLRLTGHAEAARTTIAVAASSGLRATDDITDAWLDVAVARAAPGHPPAPDPPGRARAAGRALRLLDPAAVARRAAARAPREAPAPAPAAGACTVVLGAEAVAVLLDLLGHCAFDGRAHAEGRGPLAGRLGTRVAASAINLADTPRLPRTLPRLFDAEGVPKAPIPLIQDGVAHRVVHDLASAAAAGTASTGHATWDGGGPRPRNLVLIGGGAQDEAELARPVERGVLVPALEHAHVVDAATGLVAATAPLAFAIEDGEVGAALRPLRLTDEPLRLLAATEALGATQELTLTSRAGEPAHGVVCPPLRAHGVPLRPAAA
jgi:predicted Zn-dependent protease